MTFFCICSLIINFLPFPAARDQAADLQLAKMMGDRGAGHLHKGRNIDNAFFAMAKQPKDPHTAGV